MNGIIKYDFTTGKTNEFSFGPNKSGGESFFIVDPGRKTEDGGWLMNFIYDEKKETSEFIIVDAEELKLIATVILPRRVPYGLHGNWIAGR